MCVPLILQWYSTGGRNVNNLSNSAIINNIRSLELFATFSESQISQNVVHISYEFRWQSSECYTNSNVLETALDYYRSLIGFADLILQKVKFRPSSFSQSANRIKTNLFIGP